MFMRRTGLVVCCLLLLGLFSSSAFAGHDDRSTSIFFYNRDTGDPMPVTSLVNRTVITGPLVSMHLHYVILNKFPGKTEVCFNLHAPKDTLLVGFGYYYQGRFINGKMYDKEEAWKIYQAVTSRGRDPGVMDRDSDRDYHAQIFPVEAGHDLEVEINLRQVLGEDAQGFFTELPVVLHDKETPIHADMTVRWNGMAPAALSDNFDVARNARRHGHAAVLSLQGAVAPAHNCLIHARRAGRGVITSAYSGMTRNGQGYYLLLLSSPRALRQSRLRLSGSAGSGLSMPTRFHEVAQNGRVYVVGRYRHAGTLHLRLSDEAGHKITAAVKLSGTRLSSTAVAPLWVDKRISLLQENGRRDWRPEIIRLSKRYHVMSEYTSMLAIPREELARYKQMLAQEKLSTNTRSTGGGGGDPWISVQAPADARQVVAVFPDGETKQLAFNVQTQRWTGRFDLPFGTAEGLYRVTIIVVQHDGTRTRFILEYRNLLSSGVAANAAQLQAAAGSGVTLRVTGTGIARAVAVAPWGERTTLFPVQDGWQGQVNVPAHWQRGRTELTVVLLDGAHNRTEISVELQVK